MIIFSTMQECTSVGMVRGLLVLSLASEEHSSMQPSPEIGNKRKRKGPALPVQFKFFLNSIFEKKKLFLKKKNDFLNKISILKNVSFTLKQIGANLNPRGRFIGLLANQNDKLTPHPPTYRMPCAIHNSTLYLNKYELDIHVYNLENFDFSY